MHNSITLYLPVTVALSFLVAAESAAQPEPDLDKQAGSYFMAQDWGNAVKAYEALTTSNPRNGRYWYRLGFALHSLGKYKDAVEAYTRSVEIGGNPTSMYNLACSYAQLEDREMAFKWLGKSTEAGFSSVEQLVSDEDLAGLRHDVRFDALVTQARQNATPPCERSPEYCQLDFWMGDWNVYSNDQLAGTNKIERVLDSCVLLESWTGKGGYNGKSFNYYTQSTGKWHQLWLDNKGGYISYLGEFKDGSMRFEGENVSSDGTRELSRMTFTPLPDGRVRQFIEQSKDGGKKWYVWFEGFYVREGDDEKN